MSRYTFGNCTLNCDPSVGPLPLPDGGAIGDDILQVSVAACGSDGTATEAETCPSLCFTGECDFVANRSGSEVRLRPHPGASEATMQRLLLDHALPRLLDFRGRLVLHAGAVDAGGRALAFVGMSGAGKSTLTGYLSARGYTLLTDDALVVEAAVDGAKALPTYRSMRLRPDSFDALYARETPSTADDGGKLAPASITGITTPAGPLPLATLFVLGSAAARDVCLAPLTASSACMAIIANAFQFDNLDPDRARQRLQQAALLCASTPVFRLDYPRKYTALAQVHDAVLGQLAAYTAGTPEKIAVTRQ